MKRVAWGVSVCVAIVGLILAGCGGSSSVSITFLGGTALAIDQGQQVVINVTLTNDAANQGVTWTCSGAACTNLTTTTTSATFMANGATGTAMITATSVKDPSSSKSVTVTVTASPSTTTTQAQLTAAPATVGQSYSFTLTASGGAGALTWTATALPANGLSINSSTGAITGTPTTQGTITFTYTVKDSSAAGVESSTSGSLTITINPAPVLSITKTHTGSFTQGQQGATYTVTVSNAAGAGPTVGTTVTVTDTVPSGETLVSMAGSGWTCKSGGTTCTRSDVLAAGASYPAITVTVNVSASASSPQTNNVSVSGGGSATANGSDPTTIVEPVLTISKSHTGNFNVGQQNATYSVTVGNNGSAPTSGTVTVTETVPTGETLVSMAGTGWTCASGGTTCTRSDALAVTSSYPPITVTVNVAANATSPQTNKAGVSGGGSVSANASDPTTILYPVLKTTKSHTGNFNLGQQNATYTVTVGNTGTGAAAPTVGTVTMTETVPSGETLVSMTGTGWTCGVPNPANACTRSDALAVGSSYPAITVTVNVSATASTPQTNQVSASGGGAAAAANASDPTTILYPALNITKSHTGNFTQGQTAATYTVTVSNNGSAPTVGTVTMTETAPSGETLVAMTGVGWTCGAPTNAANACTRSDALAVASSYPSITVTVNVASNATTPQTNQVSVSGGGATATANASDPTTIVEPVLGITKSHSGNFTIGQAGASYTVTVSNSGTASTSGIVTVTDTLPSGESLVSISGTGWTCGVPNPANVCTRSDALATASSYPNITVTVNVAANASSPQTNQVSVSGGGSASANASDPTIIVEPTLSITKSHTGNFTQGQTGATYTVTVSNTGTASTSGAVEVTETVPAGESLVSMAGTGWTCPGTGGATTCDRSDALANGSSYPTITVTVNVSGTATSPQVNQVSVSGGGAPSTASESTTDSTVINQVSVTFSSGQFSTIAAGAAGVTVTASVANDTGSKGVTWTLTAGGSNCAPTCGSLSNQTTTSVTYTPPATIPSSPDNTPTITATSVADTGQSASFNFTIGSADPCASAGTGGESLLSGSYAFLLKGLDNGTGSGETGPEPALVGGVLTFSGTGTISAGAIDMNLNSTAGVASHSVTSGTYKIGTSGSADQQRVCMSVTTSAGTQHYRASINSSGTIAHMIGFDSAGPFVSGEMKKQSSTIPTTVSGNFAFGVSSAQNTASCNNSVCGGKFAAAGIFDFTSGGSVTGGEVDYNADGGLDNSSTCTTFASCGPVSITSGGSYSISANGRGTLSFTPSGSNGAVTAVMYVVSSTDALILGSQDQTSNTAFAGEAIKQSGSLTLSGNYVGAVTRLGSTAGDSRVELLRGNFSSGNITNFTQYKNDSGTVSVQSGGSGTYTISGTGRMLPNVGGAGPVLYLVSSSEAFFLGQSTAVDSGFFQSQTSTASPSTTNAFGTIDPATSNVNEQDGLAAFSSPNVNVTQDQNSLNGGQQAGKTQSQTFSVDATGFGEIPSGCTPATQGSCQFVFYVITSTSAIGTDFGGSDPAVQPLDH